MPFPQPTTPGPGQAYGASTCLSHLVMRRRDPTLGTALNDSLWQRKAPIVEVIKKDTALPRGRPPSSLISEQEWGLGVWRLPSPW